MDNRKMEILNAIINSYIDCPIPVGSRTISKDYNLGVSSATIRNEMADLEDLGYLNKPHTSAGRIPSDKAYRFFVDELEKKTVNNTFEIFNEMDLRSLMLEDAKSLDRIFENTTRLLSKFTNSTSYIVSFKKPDTKIKFIQLLNIDMFSVLLLVVGNKGVVEKQIMNTSVSISDEDLAEISKKLNNSLIGLDFQKINGIKLILKGPIVEYGDFISEVVRRIGNFSQKVSEIDFYYDGLTNILDFEEYADVKKARDFIRFIENKEAVLNFIQGSENLDFDVVIGNENEKEIMKNNSIIRASFKPKNQRLGQIGIIGPIRMNYRDNIRIVKIFRNNLEYILDKIVR